MGGWGWEGIQWRGVGRDGERMRDIKRLKRDKTYSHRRILGLREP
jgi:hypothetical protein